MSNTKSTNSIFAHTHSAPICYSNLFHEDTWQIKRDLKTVYGYTTARHVVCNFSYLNPTIFNGIERGEYYKVNCTPWHLIEANTPVLVRNTSTSISNIHSQAQYYFALYQNDKVWVTPNLIQENTDIVDLELSTWEETKLLHPLIRPALTISQLSYGGLFTPQYKYIVKDEDGDVKLFVEKPTKDWSVCQWTSEGESIVVHLNPTLFACLHFHDEEPTPLHPQLDWSLITGKPKVVLMTSRGKIKGWYFESYKDGKVTLTETLEQKERKTTQTYPKTHVSLDGATVEKYCLDIPLFEAYSPQHLWLTPLL